MGKDSNLDVLVIMPDGTHRRQTAQAIYRHMWSFGVAKDIVVVTESDLQAYGENTSMYLEMRHERTICSLRGDPSLY
jgi:hypothetical protein